MSGPAIAEVKVENNNESAELKPVLPGEIEEKIRNNWDSSVRVELAPEGGSLHIPRDWDHGDPDEPFDAIVHFDNGILTTDTISGTKLETGKFLDWGLKKGFKLYCGDKPISPDQAEFLLSTDMLRDDKKPLVEMRRTKADGVPISIRINGTLWTPEMNEITKIGNNQFSTPDDQDRYVRDVQRTIKTIATHGTTRLKKMLGIDPDAIKEEIDDDVFASLASALGYMDLRKSLGFWPEKPYVVIKGLNITTQAATVGVTRSEMTDTPLIIEACSLAEGLGGTPHDLNYIRHINSKEMVFGDVGEKTKIPGIEFLEPILRRVNGGSLKHRNSYFYRGGEPIRRYIEQIRNDPASGKSGIKTCELVLRLARLGKGLEEYAVGVRGIDVLQELQTYQAEQEAGWLT